MSESSQASPKEKTAGLKHKPDRASKRALIFAASRHRDSDSSATEWQLHPQGDDPFRSASAPLGREAKPLLPPSEPHDLARSVSEDDRAGTGELSGYDLSGVPATTHAGAARTGRISPSAPFWGSNLAELAGNGGRSRGDGRSGNLAPVVQRETAGTSKVRDDLDLLDTEAQRENTRPWAGEQAGTRVQDVPSQAAGSGEAEPVEEQAKAEPSTRLQEPPPLPAVGPSNPKPAEEQAETGSGSGTQVEESHSESVAPGGPEPAEEQAETEPGSGTQVEDARSESVAPGSSAPAAAQVETGPGASESAGPATQAQDAQVEPAGPNEAETTEVEAEAVEQAEETLKEAAEKETGGAAEVSAQAETQAAAAAPAAADKAVGAQEENAQKSLQSDTVADTHKLADEVASVIHEEMHRSPTESAPEGVVQRGPMDAIRGAVSRGANWIAQNVVAPIRRLASAGWGHVTRLAGRFREAYRETDAPAWQVPRKAFQAFVRMRNEATEEALEMQRASRQQAVAEGRMTPAQAAEPSFLQSMDSIVDSFESGMDSYMGVSAEVVEGAVVGDFIENPTGWNTVGQIAIGFVPYAGQVADVRDLVACIGKLSSGAWRDPVEWINLVLIGIGFIPGLGDIVKAGGRGAISFIRETGPTILRKGREIWGQVARRVPQMIDQARRFGQNLWNSARRIGNNLLERARGLVSRAGDAVSRAREAVQGAMRSARDRAASIARGIRERASNIMSRVRTLLGPVGDAISGAVRGAIAQVRRVTSQAADLVRRGIRRVQDGIRRLRTKVTEFYQKARTFITETVPNAMRRAREWVANATRRVREAINRRIAQGRRMLSDAYQRARRFVTDKVKQLKERAIRIFQEHIRPMAGRIRSYLVRRLEQLWKSFSGIYGGARTLFVNWLRDVLGIELPGGDGGPGTEPGGGPGTEPDGGSGGGPGGGPGTEPDGGSGGGSGGGPDGGSGGGSGPEPQRPPGPGPGPGVTPTPPTPGPGPGPNIPKRIVIDGFPFSGSTLPTGGQGIVQLNQLCDLEDSVKAGIRVIRIEGHTDRVPVRPGSSQYESLEDLSAQRADAVRDELKKAGLETPSGNILMGAAEAQVPRNASNRERGRDRKVVILWEAR